MLEDFIDNFRMRSRKTGSRKDIIQENVYSYVARLDEGMSTADVAQSVEITQYLV